MENLKIEKKLTFSSCTEILLEIKLLLIFPHAPHLTAFRNQFNELMQWTKLNFFFFIFISTMKKIGAKKRSPRGSHCRAVQDYFKNLFKKIKIIKN